MKILFKSIVTSLLIATMTLSMSNTAFASNKNILDVTKTPLYYEALSQYTGLSVAEIKTIEKTHGDLSEIFGVYVEGAKGEYSTLSSVEPSDDVVPMTQTQYNNLLSNLEDGDILVTKDSWTAIINHGHSCLVNDVVKTSTSTLVYVVEAFGPGALSDFYRLGDTHNHWRNYNRVRVYYPTNTTKTVRSNAGFYAWERLQDKEYDPLASVDSTRYLNCATLIWQAYKSENVSLKTSMVPIIDYVYDTVYPKDFVTDTNNTCRYKVNWSGGDHTW